jgi:hypothetical protein
MTVLLVTLVVMALVGLGLPLGWLTRPLRAGARRLRPLPPPAPVGMPIERVATNLRRLDRDLRRYAVEGPLPGKHTRVTAAQQAYGDLLVQACAALDVDQRLHELSGSDRAVEVLRVEAALAAAGLPIAA